MERTVAQGVTMVGGPATPVGLSAVTAISSGSLVPSAGAASLPSPAGRRTVDQAPSRPRVWMSHHRTLVLSPGMMVNDVAPSPGATVTAGAAGVALPSQGNAGTMAFS